MITKCYVLLINFAYLATAGIYTTIIIFIYSSDEPFQGNHYITTSYLKMIDFHDHVEDHRDDQTYYSLVLRMMMRVMEMIMTVTEIRPVIYRTNLIFSL